MTKTTASVDPLKQAFTCLQIAVLWMLGLIAAPGLAQGPAAGLGVPVPKIPKELLDRIPPGCQSSWESDTPGKMPAGHPHNSPLFRTASLDDLLDGEDPLKGLGPQRKRTGSGLTPNAQPAPGNKIPDPHEALWVENCYPSAATCSKCHPDHYEEWRASSHAYSSVSPMFHVFEQTISELSMGTVGYFCVRCHAPVATQMPEIERSTTLLDAPRVIREGITCIACHRVNETYGKSNGHRRIEPGNIHAPVYGNGPGQGLRDAILNKSQLKIKTDPNDKSPGQAIHNEAKFFQTLTASEFCMPCHQVAVHPGIALEVVWNQYRNSPSVKRGISCQDCHMGKVPGKALGYACGPIAELAGKPYGESRKRTNHNFWGPNYSIAHPGIFPHNLKADRWSPRDWLAFDWRAGWGKEDFERSVANNSAICFPQPWDDADDRRDARKIIDDNLRRAALKRQSSIQTISNALCLDGPHLDRPAVAGQPLKFHIRVCNTSDGHNLPTASLGAQPQQWLNVSVKDPFDNIVWESGYLDSNGDLAEWMSVDVQKKRIQPDYQLFNLQTKFLITNQKGPDREFPLPVPYDIDQIPFLRPGNVPFSVLNHPPFLRMEAHSIPPEGSKVARYKVPADRIRSSGTYRISARFRVRLEPPYFMRLCKATPEMIRRMNEGILDVKPQTTEVFVR